MSWDEGGPVANMSLLFGKGQRPDIAALQAFAAVHSGFSICQPHLEGDGDIAVGAELLADGLTFDLKGLAPARGGVVPEGVYRFDVSDEGAWDEVEALTLAPGPHLSGGTALIPVVWGMLGLASNLSHLDGLVAIAWHPARSWIGPHYFVSMTRNWLEGGVFPARGLVGLDVVADGALQSEGAAFFTGQEIRIEPELMGDKAMAVNIAVRLIDHLVEKGPCAEPGQMTGPEGRTLHVVPSSNQRMVRIWGG